MVVVLIVHQTFAFWQVEKSHIICVFKYLYINTFTSIYKTLNYVFANVYIDIDICVSGRLNAACYHVGPSAGICMHAPGCGDK